MRFLIWFILGYIGYRIIKGFLVSRDVPSAKPIKDTEAFQDPVCGVYVSAEEATVGRLNGEKIYFCSRECLDKYQEKLHSTSHKNTEEP
jgi:YHS domain-containing protein